jgi:transcriptional regulator with XRE-family HTH domain
MTDAIRRAILEAPISRYELARRVGVTQATLSGFVNGKHGIGSDLLDRIAPVLGLRLVIGRQHKARK